MAGYGFTNRGNFNTYKAMERHMAGNSISGGAHRPSSYAHHGYPAAGESFLSMKDNVVAGGEHPSSSNNSVEQDLFEKVRMQMSQLNYRRRNGWVKPSTGKNNNNGEYDHKPNGLQTGKYNFYAAQGGAQRFRFGAPAAGDVSAK